MDTPCRKKQLVLSAIRAILSPLLLLSLALLLLSGGIMRASSGMRVNVELVELVGEDGGAAVRHDAMATGHVELRSRMMFWETYGIQLYGTSEQLSCCTADSHLFIHPTSAGITVALKHGSRSACSSGSGWPGKRWNARASTPAAWDSSVEQRDEGLPEGSCCGASGCPADWPIAAGRSGGMPSVTLAQ